MGAGSNLNHWIVKSVDYLQPIKTLILSTKSFSVLAQSVVFTLSITSCSQQWQLPNKNNICKNWHIGVSQKVDIKASLKGIKKASLGQPGAESPQIISPSRWRLFLTHLQLSFTLLWMARNLHKLQSWNSNMLCKQVCSFCPSCLGTSIVKILEKGAILLRFLWSFYRIPRKRVFPFPCFNKKISERSSEDFQKHSNSRFLA